MNKFLGKRKEQAAPVSAAPVEEPYEVRIPMRREYGEATDRHNAISRAFFGMHKDGEWHTETEEVDGRRRVVDVYTAKKGELQVRSVRHSGRHF